MKKSNPKISFNRRMKMIIPAVFFISAFVIALSGCENPEEETITEGQVQASATPAEAAVDELSQMPAFKLEDTNGRIIDLQSFKGKKVFVNLWATWCPPCRAELPSIEKLYAGSDRNSSQFLMISFDNSFKTAISFAEKSGMKAPLYYPAQELPELFNVQGIPATFIFDEEGKLIKKIEGASRYDTREYFELLK